MQRRHQKIIEEAPAVRLTFHSLNIRFKFYWSCELVITHLQPNISAEFRAHLGQAAVSAAKVRSFSFKMLISIFSALIIVSLIFEGSEVLIL